MPATRTPTLHPSTGETAHVFRPYATRLRLRHPVDPAVPSECFSLDSLPDVDQSVVRRTRKVRETCSPEQTAALQKLFDETQGYPTAEQKIDISRRLDK
jgi:hypothetical protein